MDIEAVIQRMFCWSPDRHTLPEIHERFPQKRQRNTRFMEVPIHRDTIELPTFLTEVFKESYRRSRGIEVFLGSYGRMSDYKSLDASMRQALLSSFTYSGPVLLSNKEETTGYYATQGAIFNQQMNPLMVTAWRLERVTGQEDVKFRMIRPVLKVSPACFTGYQDSVKRYIISKLIPLIANMSLKATNAYAYTGPFVKNASDKWSVRIEIDAMPWLFREAERPSISTTNQELIQLVLDNIDTMFT